MYFGMHGRLTNRVSLQVEMQSADVKCKDMQQEVTASKAQVAHLEQCLKQAQVCSEVQSIYETSSTLREPLLVARLVLIKSPH